jgi:hypothetical protein|nr:MAG TPA: hypothetical protein [Caudoviricetes sp.]
MAENEASVRLEVIRAGLLSGIDAKIVSSEENIKTITVIINALEELELYRASVFSGDMTQKMLKEEYCKAVDDFAESVKNLIADSSVIRFKDIDEIAEQLKVGDGE